MYKPLILPAIIIGFLVFLAFLSGEPPSKNYAGPRSGTAFFINSEGYLVTANHVVRNVSSMYVLYKGVPYTATVVSRSIYEDIAFLKVVGLKTEYLKMHANFTSGMVSVYGYPQPTRFGVNLKKSSGFASIMVDPSISKKVIVYDCMIYPGNSGGPVVSKRGTVGLVTNMYDLPGLAINGGSKRGYGTISTTITRLAANIGIRTTYNLNTNNYFCPTSAVVLLYN